MAELVPLLEELYQELGGNDQSLEEAYRSCVELVKQSEGSQIGPLVHGELVKVRSLGALGGPSWRFPWQPKTVEKVKKREAFKATLQKIKDEITKKPAGDQKTAKTVVHPHPIHL